MSPAVGEFVTAAFWSISQTGVATTSGKKTLIQHLGQLDLLHGRENVVLLGPPDRGSQCTFLLRE